MRAHLSLSLDDPGPGEEAGGEQWPPQGSPGRSAEGTAGEDQAAATLPGPPPPSLHSSPQSDSSSDEAVQGGPGVPPHHPSPAAHGHHGAGLGAGHGMHYPSAVEAEAAGKGAPLYGGGVPVTRQGPVAYVPSVPTARPLAQVLPTARPAGRQVRGRHDAGSLERRSHTEEGEETASGVITSPTRVRSMAVADLPRPREQAIYHPQSMQNHATRQQLAREEKMRRERALEMSGKPWKHQTTKARPFHLAVDRRAKTRDAEHGAGAAHALGDGPVRDPRSVREREARYRQQLEGRAVHMSRREASRREASRRERRLVLGVGRTALGTAPPQTRLRRGSGATATRRKRGHSSGKAKASGGRAVPVPVPVSVPVAAPELAGASAHSSRHSEQVGDYAAEQVVRPSPPLHRLPSSPP